MNSCDKWDPFNMIASSGLGKKALVIGPFFESLHSSFQKRLKKESIINLVSFQDRIDF